MEWDIAVHRDEKYIEVVTRGTANRENSLKMAKVVADSMKRNRITKALIDHRGIQSVSGEIVDIYERPKILKLIGLILRIRIAELIKHEHKEHFEFLETVFVNRGYSFFVFYKKDKAIEWLLE
ncbi:MAG: hypothetical protein WCZ90_17030 [Melioribacteraceae bacterium]